MRLGTADGLELVSWYAGAAWLLNVPEDFVLPLAGVGGLCLILWKNQQQARS